MWLISKLARDRFSGAATVVVKDAATSSARCCRNSRDKINCNDKVRVGVDLNVQVELPAHEDDNHKASPSLPSRTDTLSRLITVRAGTADHDKPDNDILRLKATRQRGGATQKCERSNFSYIDAQP